MKKFKAIKSFDETKLAREQKLTKEQMYQTTGGMRPIANCTCGTRSVCHVDGTDDND